MSTPTPRLFFTLAIAIAITKHSQAQEYYTEDYTGIHPVYDGRADEVKADYWTVRLYRKGEKTGGRDNWGSITGDSAAEVMRELRENQEYDKKWGNPQSPWTYLNYVGPIAGHYKQGVDRKALQDIDSIFSEIRKAASMIRTILQTKPKTDPYRSVGKTLKEYTDNFKDVQKRLSELGRQLDTVEPQFAVIADQLIALRDEHKLILKAIEVTIQAAPKGRRESFQISNAIAHQNFMFYGFPFEQNLKLNGNVLNVQGTDSTEKFSFDVDLEYKEPKDFYLDKDPSTYLARMGDGKFLRYKSETLARQAIGELQAIVRSKGGTSPNNSALTPQIPNPLPEKLKPTLQFNPETGKLEKATRTLPPTKPHRKFNPATGKLE